MQKGRARTMPDEPPASYEDLIRLIHERYDRMSKSQRRVALFLTQSPNDSAVASLGTIAGRCGVHASSLVRFAQSLGYSGFKELQGLFRKRLTAAAPGFEARVRALEDELGAAAPGAAEGPLRDLVARDIASLRGLLGDVDAGAFAAAAEHIERAGTVYLLGQLRSEPVVVLLRYVLTMLGKRCVLLDPSGGLATHMARTIAASDVLVAVSFRFYAGEVVNIVEAVAERAAAPIVAITDSTLSPLARSATCLFAVPEHDDMFSRSLAAPMCLAQALTLAVAERVQSDAARPRIPTVTGEGRA